MGLRKIQSADEWERSMRPHERQRPSAKCRPTPPAPRRACPRAEEARGGDHAPARAWPRNLRGPPAPAPQKRPDRIGRLGVQRPKPPGAPQSAKREGARKGETPQERMSTQADSRKHSLGVTRPEGLSQTGGGLQTDTWKIPPHPECSYNPTSQRLGGNGHPHGLASQAHGRAIAVREIAN